MSKESTEQQSRTAMIVDQFGGIFPPFEAFYIQSIIYAASCSEEAFKRYDAALRDASSAELIVSIVHEALTHAAGVSRFFWPMGRGVLAVARGARLRSAFEVDDASPLKHRRLRNAFEHFDEDLDTFLLTERVGHFFPGSLVGDHHLADDQLGQIFKLVDPDQQICVLLGEKYEFGRMRDEVQRILAAALSMDRHGARLPNPPG